MTSSIALAAISGGSAVAGAFIGAAAGHYTTIRSQKLQSNEDHFRHRQGIYHHFLDCAHEFIHSAAILQAAKDNDEWTAWFRDFETKLTSVQLFGTADVRAAAMDYKKILEGVFEAVGEASGNSIEERRGNAFREHEHDVLVAYDTVIATMRTDVGLSD